MPFELLGEISQIETIATASGIREIARLRKLYGRGRWRKRKGVARIRPSGWLNTRCRGTLVRGVRGRAQRAENQRNSMTQKSPKSLVVCIENEGYPASLETRKIYVSLRDIAAEKHGMLRVVDESGDDYLYPKTFFRPISLPQPVKRAVLAAT